MYKKVFSDVQCCKNRRRLYFRVKIRRHIGCTTLFWDWDLVLRNLHGVGGGEHLSSCQSSHVLERESTQDGGREWRNQKLEVCFACNCRMIKAFIFIRRDVPRLLNLLADSSKTLVPAGSSDGSSCFYRGLECLSFATLNEKIRNPCSYFT